MSANTPRIEPVRLADYRPTHYAIRTVALDFRLDPEATEVTADLRLERRDGTAPGTPLVLDGDELELVAVEIDGARLKPDAYEAGPSQLTLLDPPAGAFTLRIVTRIAPALNTKLMGLYRTSGNYCTQCEAEGFRRITYFLDRPDVLAVYRTRIEARKAEAPYLLANGNRIEGGDIPGTDRHYAVWHDPHPKPSYLFALVGGDFDVLRDRFVTMSGRDVALEIYVEHGKVERAAYAMDSLKRSMKWDEEVFGLEYDLDIFMIVAVSDFNMGAMENKGLNVFNDKYVLAARETATDADYSHIEGVIAHEYFHNWTGNRITCRNWFQLCLKEGLTVFRDQEFSSDQRSRAVKRIMDVKLLKSHQFPEDAGPLAHPVRPETYREINNFYTATVYEKGAEVVRMLKTMLGPDGFRAGMDLYFKRHDGDAATIEDFLAAFADATGRDLTQFMLWYRQAGTPELAVSTDYDPGAKTLRLTFEQTCPPSPGQAAKEPMAIPVRFGLVGPNGEDMDYGSIEGVAVAGDVMLLTAPRHEVVVSGVGARPVPSLLRGFSAPVKLSVNLDTDDQLFLLAHDADPFNRWQAAQTLATRTLVEGSKALGDGRAMSIDTRLIDAYRQIAADDRLDHAFRALVLGVPGEADIAREIGSEVDPDRVYAARETLRRAIATGAEDVLAGLHDGLALSGAYAPDAASAGRRSLRNMALELLLLVGGPDAEARVVAHYEAADNMTDRYAALSALVLNGSTAAGAMLADFYRRFEGDSLVIDKWFVVQAMAPVAATLDRVRALTGHPAFSFTNPNRFRALVTTFATGNQTQFARADGAGFGFVADMVLDMDKRNPQVAARLLSAFRSWRALEGRRRAQAEVELKRVAAAPGLSRDVADIAARCLQ
ncbi:aminopeptidase N [Prosthecodimorpha staleyi]|uniref:Aminopeptidase N n=1 Tax=Prosthecodimorpha staleyi TaxID=2840188 RepID=A0A947GAG3_9HYPH|nr:aminopeptidase N [Prosthecodimorpha staleyi]MBT9289098.1 aminopeptidase N [Prosthecodimorpha staleyi]